MRNKSRLSALVISIIAIFISAFVLYNNFKDTVSPDSAPQPTVSAPVKTKALDITVTDQSESVVNLSDFLGKGVVLNFWASWCPPCREEMPHFDKLSKEYGDVVFMMVDLTDGSRETKEKAFSYIEESGYSFDIYFDLDGSAARTYRIQSIPTTVFVDKEGNISYKKIGAISESQLKSNIEKIR